METKKETIMLPKFRYDEVNRKYKAVKAELEDKETELNTLRKEHESLKEKYSHALTDLQVKETFVEGGITRKQYDAIIPKMTCKDEEKIALAEAIVQLIKEQRKERGNENGN